MSESLSFSRTIKGMNTSDYARYSLPYLVSSKAFLGRMKILVAGDTRPTVECLRSHFLQKGCEVEAAYTSLELRRKLSRNFFDLIICGFLANEEYAFRVVELVRRTNDVRMLFLTGKKDSGFISKLLNLGADDCLSSPASLFELDARVLRLCHRNTNLRFRETKIVFGERENLIELDLASQKVIKNGQPILLTKTEYRILLHLALQKGTLVPKENLEKILFPFFALSEIESSRHSVNMHILNLRKKFGSALRIKTVSCHGFILLI